MEKWQNIKALTFDLFGTVLDLAGSLTPFIAQFLQAKGSGVLPHRFWEQWRYRQRIEQYQDNIMMLGHSGYLETARRAFVYTLSLNGVEASRDEVKEFMGAWQELSPFPEVVPALERLKARYKLVALSNGEASYLSHLVKNQIRWDFDEVISVEVAGAFKPHPGVYRRAAGILGLEMGECLMVSANSFDVMGARSCGFRGAYVDRYRLPYEDTLYQPDIVVQDFTELAETLL
ncbi:MAG: haloacid dehalogenase type II [Deltaproteobacteria bacterium]|jgi:2-haloacid dehalogenase|nr:haloacid dehalogenase type II [Deltaproteobacteria bacterium]